MIRKLAQISALFFIFTIPWENAFTLGSLGSVSRLAGLAAAGLWVVSVIFRKGVRSFNIFHLFVFAFLLYNVSTIFWTLEYDYTRERATTYLQMAIQIWMLWDLITTEKMLRSAMRAFLLGAYVTIGSTIANYLSGTLISEWEYGRFSGGGQNAVELALILSLCFPFAWHLASTQKPGKWSTLLKFFYYLFIPASLFAIILTGSRTALFTIVPGLLYIMISFGRFKPVYRIIGLFVFLVAVFVGQSLLPQATLERLSTIGSSIASGDLGGRMALWRQSLEIFVDHPILGIGSGSLAAPDQLGAVTHNTFISILTETGLVGFSLFLGILVTAILQSLKQPRAYILVCITTLLTWVVGVQSLTYEYTKPTWFFLSLIAISAGVIDRVTAAKEKPEALLASPEGRRVVSRPRPAFRYPYSERRIKTTKTGR